ncbi:hypothetical protein PVAND_002239 [Polypedilum vanderplanki]|uniref:Netrin receptor UNC5 n=1 Tax=Polypedilum vanderplanki TaxID=319348 RepID=A0A9J6BQD4_POLVA|nr:hypothetical protein PVAND_002239 [Polypedilum vanderplanki]
MNTTSRLSYASSPESDLELSPGPSASLSLGNLPQLVKSSSDPSIATNQDNLDRDREEMVEGMPPPYTTPYDHSTAHTRRLTVDNKYGFSPSQQQQPTDEQALYGTRPTNTNGIYGQNVPDLPPRIDRTSKPSSSTPGSSLPSRTSSSVNSNGGTLGRSAQERLFGSAQKQALSPDDQQDDLYTASNKLLNTLEPKKMGNEDSLERRNIHHHHHHHSNAQNSLDRTNSTQKNGSSYDSVSSYDSYNTNQPQQAVTTSTLSVQNRLGPNAPDDLKSIPPPTVNRASMVNSQDYATNQRNSMNDSNYSYNNGMDQHAQPRNSMVLPQRPTNLLIESPRKPHMMETKTDYGKYSRNNSATQADYIKPPKIAQVVPPIPNSQPPVSSAFKPVPPPKPKNYRPPMPGTNGNGNGNQWENGESLSPRSPPNGIYYSTTNNNQQPPSQHQHYHHQSMTNGSSPHYSHHQFGGNGNHHSNYGQPPMPPQHMQSPPMFGNGYNNHQYYGSGNYRNPGFGNLPIPSQYGIDLTNREQRGSAFELYRKPQIGAHNMSDMQPPPISRQNLPPKQQHRYDMVSVTPEPPELPAKAKKNPLKSPLKAIKKAIVKGTNSLRRQASFMDSNSGESKKARSLRRQHSMMERGSNRMFYPPPPHHQQDYYEYQQQQYYNYYYQQQRYYPQDERFAWYQRHERYYPTNMAYDDEQPLYGNYGPPPEESIYANRALIELERSAPIQTSGGRIVRRHSMNERQREVPAFATLTKRRSKYAEDIDDRFANMSIEEPIYQSQRGSLMYQEQMKPRPMPRQQPVERPLDDNQKLLQARKDINSPGTSSASTTTSLSSPSKERNLRDSRRQLKDQIYQSRLETMQSMAEPNYLTRSSSGTSSNAGSNLRSQPIYESKKEAEESHENENDKTMNSSTECEASNENNEQEKSLLEVIEETLIKNKSQDHLNEVDSIPFVDEETPAAKSSDTIEESEDSLQRTAIENTVITKKEPININNIIKRAAPPPPPVRSPTTAKTTTAAPTESVYESHTSIDTQASLPTSIGPPNAQSTPYASELTLKEQKSLAKARFLAAPPIRSPITTKGYFDEMGGILEDNVWNVSLIIPPGALPTGQKQEIYFTVTDPRMSEAVGGPPLDMENGEKMLSPLVMCGPVGLEFLEPVTLNIPHCASSMPSLGLSVKATDSEKNLTTNWDNIDLPPSNTAHQVSVKVDHF